ncbi:Class 2 transcription repressor NC2, alpha subunit (DRAP1) [Trachipleistophora hominis]|uniref:Class 2 transcription repressor NC2, alpha subunit (DRAP1) n=1 Tax=Trachipleistophora hominis TaxID=72359 RepID=L7JWY5_TRAHO|nr:Class 2 transcription repressor NC2, alpha subunit (DRAP1) [Trachipleistophora hominis]
MARKSKNTKKEKRPKKAKINEPVAQESTNTAESNDKTECSVSARITDEQKCSTSTQAEDSKLTNGSNTNTSACSSVSTLALDKKKRFRFPTARIKKIMQSDEDVGKISTYAPVVLGKATELFLFELVNAAVKLAESDKRKVEVEDLERVVKENEQFIFLKSYRNEE